MDGQHYHTVIIGGGPAGLSAALVLGRCMRRALVCDSGRYRNERSQALHCYMGHDGIAPAELLESSRRQLERYETITRAPRGECGRKRWARFCGPLRVRGSCSRRDAAGCHRRRG